MLTESLREIDWKGKTMPLSQFEQCLKDTFGPKAKIVWDPKDRMAELLGPRSPRHLLTVRIGRRKAVTFAKYGPNAGILEIRKVDYYSLTWWLFKIAGQDGWRFIDDLGVGGGFFEKPKEA